MAAEIRALEEQGTWVLEKLPSGKKALGSKWVYMEKGDEHGNLLRLKARYLQLNVLIYVDDLIVAGNNEVALSKFKAYLGKCFKMKDLGVLKYFLGLEVARSKQGIYICQRKYSLDIISETGLLGAKPADFPMEQNHKLALAEGRVLEDVEKYRRLVGRLIYLAITRPDLAYPVHILSQFMQNPREQHWEAALRVVRYLKKNPIQDKGYFFDRIVNCDLKVGVTLIGLPFTRRSLIGWFMLLGFSPVSWKTKKQQTVCKSSAEAE
ncbi:uncharacterized protein LOC110685730 [Chenopodium quinoa]|uniref:uncharacterized protein LOC110685730 n=1 Tax=Chenopodium quinoa TaxID=63459 RepID=UPI000B796AAC|nr:uncharacterized protein LOC110685730 [Chenopodium quinoa]